MCMCIVYYDLYYKSEKYFSYLLCHSIGRNHMVDKFVNII